MLQGIKLVILDYDLTLVDNIIDFYDSFNETLYEHTGRKVLFGVFYDKLIRDELSDLVPRELSSNDFWRDMRSRICSSKTYYILDNHTRFFLYVTKLMNMKNIIVSGKNCHKQYIINELAKNNILDYIDDVYTFHDLVLMNGVEEELFDKSWIINYVMSKHGVEPSETVFIGDYYMDYISSLKTKVFFIGLARNNYRYSVFRKLGVEYIARNFQEVLLYLLDLLRKV